MDQADKLKHSFTVNHAFLLKNLAVDEVFLSTCSSELLISPRDEEDILAEATNTRRASKLLLLLHRRSVSEKGVFSRLFDILVKYNEEEGGQVLKHVIAALKKGAQGPITPFSYTSSSLNERTRALLLGNEAVLIASLDTKEILPELVSYGVISVDECDAIANQYRSSEEKAKRLIDILYTRGQSGFNDFVEVLKDSGYEALALKLTTSEVVGIGDNTKYMEEVLRRGQVPPPVKCQVERASLVEQVRRELYKLRNTDGWVLVHGLPGFGKTVLAAESLRSPAMLREVFPGGVFWLSLGRMMKEDEFDSSLLLEKIRNFILRVDKHRYKPPNLEAATDYLQKVMIEQHPSSLLVLDDVWESDTAQAFGVRCRVLVTSRNADITSEVRTPFTYRVSLLVGLTNEEAMELLSKWSHKPLDSLPKEADTIIQYCRGSPLALDVIGAMLSRRNTTLARWEAIAKRLKKEYDPATPTLRRKSLGHELIGRVYDSISISIEGFSTENKQLFESLVVFDYDTVISAEVLATYWNVDEFQAEDIMNDFVSLSLAQHATPKETHLDGTNEPSDEEPSKKEKEDAVYLSFSLHNIIMEHLKTSISLENQESYHKQLVQRYSEKCEGAFADLPEDGYIFQHLLIHIHACGDMELLGQLLTNLLWVAVSCKNWYASALLDSYRRYKTFVPKEFVDSMKMFQQFLSSHLDVLNLHPTCEDVIQLALNEDEDSDIYKQAETAARSRVRHSSWFIWNNKGREALFNPFQIRPHFSNLMQCHYYSGGDMVASCSSSSVKLWEASTGLVKLKVGGKTVITGCSINEKGTILVTCSDDSEEHSCVVWKVDTKPAKQLLQFTEHKEGVKCCDLSSDSELVVSCDLGSTVMVWKTNSGEVVSSWQHSDDPINTCAFSPKADANYAIAVGDQAGHLKLWSLDGKDQMSLFLLGTPTNTNNLILASTRGHTRSDSLCSTHSVSNAISSCVFSRDGQLLAAAVGDSSAKIWDVATGQCLHSLNHSSQVLSIDLSSDAKQLAVGCENGKVMVWSLDTIQPLLDLPLHWAWVMSVRFSPKHDHILSGAYNGIVRIVECDWSHIKKPWKLYRRRFSIHFSPVKANGSNEEEGKRERRIEVDSGRYEPTIVCYNIRDDALELCKGSQGERVSIIPTPSQYKPRSWKISGDGKYSVIGYNEGVLQLVDLTKKEPEERWRVTGAHEGVILHCYFSPDNTKLVSCSHDDMTHKVWNVADGEHLTVLGNTVNNISIRPCAFFDDNVTVASAQMEGKVTIWNSETEESIHVLDDLYKPEESILCLSLSGDNKSLMAAGTSGTVAVWDTIQGDLLFMASHNECARSCSLNRSGSLAAVGHDDCILKIYDIKKKTVVATCKTHSLAWIVDAKFSPDETQIVTLSESVQWWTTHGHLQKRYLLKSTFGKYIHFSPDFKTFVTIDNTGLLYILSSLDLAN